MKTIEYKGLWWVPSNEDRKVAGILYHIPGEEIRLELIGTFNPEAASSIMAIFNAQNEDVIHGQDSDGQDITLFDCCCSISHKGKAEFATSIYKSRVLAVGMHLDSLDDSRFFKATVKIPELSYWLYPAAVQQVHLDGENGKSMYVKMDQQPNDEREVAKTQISGGYSVALCRNATFHSGEFYFKPTFEQYTSLTIERKKNASLKQFYEKAVDFERFMSLATFREVGFSELALFSKEYYFTVGKEQVHYHPVLVDTVFHQKPCSKKIEKYRFIFDYEQIKDRYQIAIKQWFKKDEKFGAIRAHFLDSIDYHGPFSYINFLVVIQAVEGYGRRYLKKEIAAYRNNLPQGRKSRPLLEILQTIFKHFSDVQKINQKTDLEAIVQTRNYHSHLLPQKNQKTVDVLDLYDLTDELRKVLLCCILSYLGLTNREIDDLTRQSHNGLFQK